ncbi:MAG TPA: hypothetical protein VFG55_00505 [Rhodanobacteraceae bacterium]|nr:hypothetical protein [Rhodanobacteraceae bacterium]
MNRRFASATMFTALSVASAPIRASVELIGFGIAPTPPPSTDIFTSIGAGHAPGPNAQAGAGEA